MIAAASEDASGSAGRTESTSTKDAVCLPLSAAADLDDEALSWLKRAYDENA